MEPESKEQLPEAFSPLLDHEFYENWVKGIQQVPTRNASMIDIAAESLQSELMLNAYTAIRDRIGRFDNSSDQRISGEEADEYRAIIHRHLIQVVKNHLAVDEVQRHSIETSLNEITNLLEAINLMQRN